MIQNGGDKYFKNLPVNNKTDKGWGYGGIGVLGSGYWVGGWARGMGRKRVYMYYSDNLKTSYSVANITGIISQSPTDVYVIMCLSRSHAYSILETKALYSLNRTFIQHISPRYSVFSSFCGCW